VYEEREIRGKTHSLSVCVRHCVLLLLLVAVLVKLVRDYLLLYYLNSGMRLRDRVKVWQNDQPAEHSIDCKRMNCIGLSK